MRLDFDVIYSILTTFFHFGLIYFYYAAGKNIFNSLVKKKYHKIDGVKEYLRIYISVIGLIIILSGILYIGAYTDHYNEADDMIYKGNKNASFFKVFIPMCITICSSITVSIYNHNRNFDA